MKDSWTQMTPTLTRCLWLIYERDEERSREGKKHCVPKLHVNLHPLGHRRSLSRSLSPQSSSYPTIQNQWCLIPRLYLPRRFDRVPSPPLILPPPLQLGTSTCPRLAEGTRSRTQHQHEACLEVESLDGIGPSPAIDRCIMLVQQLARLSTPNTSPLSKPTDSRHPTACSSRLNLGYRMTDGKIFLHLPPTKLPNRSGTSLPKCNRRGVSRALPGES